MAIDFIRSAANSTASLGGSTLNVTISTPAVGNALVACIVCGGSPVQGITGGGVTWLQGAHPTPSHSYPEIWYGLNSSGSGSVITISFVAPGSNAAAASVGEFSGIGNIDVISSSTSAGNSTTVTSAIINTSAAATVIIAMADQTSTLSSGPNSSFTEMAESQAASSDRIYAAYQIVNYAGSYSTTWTTTGGSYDTAILSLYRLPLPNQRIGLWSKDGVLACGGFDVGIPIAYGLYDDDFVAQFSGTVPPVNGTQMHSVPQGVFDRDADLNGLYGAF